MKLSFSALVVTGLLAVPAAALAAPDAETSAATNITSTSATLNGSVKPTGQTATYFFEYGRQAIYGPGYESKTAQAALPATKGKQRVSATVSGLTPNTTYHFRLTATDATGQSFGRDMTFRTLAPGTAPPPSAKQTAVSLAASRGVVVIGQSATLTGQVTGRGAAGASVQLESDAYPYGDFTPLGPAQTSTSEGRFRFVVKPSRTTRFRVTARGAKVVASNGVSVAVRKRVTVAVSDLTPARGARVRFSGFVYPRHIGRYVYVQRRAAGRWVNVGRALLRASTVARARYSRIVKVNGSATYRVVAPKDDGDHLAGRSPLRRLVVS
jgi:hypothetical protein